VVLQRSNTYWGRRSVALDGIHFIPIDSAEAALDAYKQGKLDVVTNASFEPLASKVLSPFNDFKKVAFSAVNLYEINDANAPLMDRRVRQALAIAIDRERLSNAELEDATSPAYAFAPIINSGEGQLSYDVAKAKELLVTSGFPNGEGFPPIRLVINRNDVQQRVARAVARMWKQNLNVDTTIVIKEASEIEQVRASGDYDVIRRGLVLPSHDQTADLGTVFDNVDRHLNSSVAIVEASPQEPRPSGPSAPTVETEPQIVTLPQDHEAAISQFTEIPLYFPISYSLVKPYVRGLESNSLGVVAFGQLSIDAAWAAKTPANNVP
jgi:oligopeptide transport system substrate-binding protein